MDMDIALSALAAQMTGRLSALLFATALLAPAAKLAISFLKARGASARSM